MARRDFTRHCLTALGHPAEMIGMNHSILGAKQRPCWERFPRWLAGGGLKDTGMGCHLSDRQRSRLHWVNVVGKVLGKDIGIDPGKTLRTHEEMLEDFHGRKLLTGTEQSFPLIQHERRDIDQAYHSWCRSGCLRNNKAAIGVSDQ